MVFPSNRHETKYFLSGLRLVAGCDEVGVASLAGPVVAACVVFNPQAIAGRRTLNKWWLRVRDSKTVPEEEREELAMVIKENCASFSISEVSHETIDEINIFNASRLVQKKSIDGLGVKPEIVLVDGPHKIPNIKVSQENFVKGDLRILSIAAASIIAKAHRDNLMKQLHQKFPMYGFDKHKGYPTKNHLQALKKYGVSPFHRQSFAPVKQTILEKYRMEKFRQI
jgi:ribonuclease HII